MSQGIGNCPRPNEGQSNLFDQLDQSLGNFHLGLFNQDLDANQMISAYQDSCQTNGPDWSSEINDRLKQQARGLNRHLRHLLAPFQAYQPEHSLMAVLYSAGDRTLFGKNTRELKQQLSPQGDQTPSSIGLDSLLDNQSLILRNLARVKLGDYLSDHQGLAGFTNPNYLVEDYRRIIRNLQGIPEVGEQAGEAAATDPQPEIDSPPKEDFLLKDWHDYYSDWIETSDDPIEQEATTQAIRQDLGARLRQLGNFTRSRAVLMDSDQPIRLELEEAVDYIYGEGDNHLLGYGLVEDCQRSQEQAAEGEDNYPNLDIAGLLAWINLRQRFLHSANVLIRKNQQRSQAFYKKLAESTRAELEQDLPDAYRRLRQVNRSLETCQQDSLF